ncbi:MAG: hypothetical protein ACYC7E_22510, partial [Armatimonadota bacterium]
MSNPLYRIWLPTSLGLHVLLLVLLRLVPPVTVPAGESIIQVHFMDTGAAQAVVPFPAPRHSIPTRTMASLPQPLRPRTEAPPATPSPLIPAGNIRETETFRPGAAGPRSAMPNLTAGLPQFHDRPRSGDGMPGLPSGSVERPGALADRPAGDASPLFGSGGAPAGPGVGTGGRTTTMTLLGTAGSTR